MYSRFLLAKHGWSSSFFHTFSCKSCWRLLFFFWLRSSFSLSFSCYSWSFSSMRRVLLVTYSWSLCISSHTSFSTWRSLSSVCSIWSLIRSSLEINSYISISWSRFSLSFSHSLCMSAKSVDLSPESLHPSLFFLLLWGFGCTEELLSELIDDSKSAKLRDAECPDL